MANLASDAERLLVLDWVASPAEQPLYLFIDDGRFSFSSPAAALAGLQALTSYAKARGVVFECGVNEKSLVLADGIVLLSAFISALQGSLLGGTPRHDAPSAVFLGCEEAPSHSDAVATLLQVERLGR